MFKGWHWTEVVNALWHFGLLVVGPILVFFQNPLGFLVFIGVCISWAFFLFIILMGAHYIVVGVLTLIRRT